MSSYNASSKYRSEILVLSYKQDAEFKIRCFVSKALVLLLLQVQNNFNKH